MVHSFKLRVPPYISRYFIAVTELNKMSLYFFLHAVGLEVSPLDWWKPPLNGESIYSEREHVNASSHRLPYKGSCAHTEAELNVHCAQ